MSRNRIVFEGFRLLSLQPTCAIFAVKIQKNMKRRVFVTGGARGIGKGIVEAFTRQGDEVVFCDIDPELGARTAAGTGARFCQLDVTDAAGLEGCMQQLFETLGDIDILVNNVGIGLFKPLDELSIEEFDRVIATNLRPVFITSRQLALHRRRNGNRRYGRIINLCSTRYLQSEAGTEAYSASKGGIYSLTHSLAVSLAPLRITVNAIAPGWIHVREEEPLRSEDHQFHPSGRVGEPGDIARMCLFLCDEANDFLNGQTLTVDGGATIRMIYPE
ncbi:MAG TPA: oxidoreductase [Alistipes sp.]|jgi:NAD(P)-dependent dehydrogenase (short-subunit alcohol dehydrogenase family)|nr:oxidoreductase [Alistipes sp.]HBW01549.1 oxidoreductase [Alistipes sp.]